MTSPGMSRASCPCHLKLLPASFVIKPEQGRVVRFSDSITAPWCSRSCARKMLFIPISCMLGASEKVPELHRAQAVPLLCRSISKSNEKGFILFGTIIWSAQSRMRLPFKKGIGTSFHAGIWGSSSLWSRLHISLTSPTLSFSKTPFVNLMTFLFLLILCHRKRNE